MATNFFDTDDRALSDIDGDIILAKGTTVPTDATDGYAKGCLFLDSDATSGSVLFINEGTSSSCDFNAVQTAGALFNTEQDYLLRYGTSVPSDATAGYAAGGIFMHTDGSLSATLYTNVGTSTSCDFNAIQPAGGIATKAVTKLSGASYTVSSPYTVLSTDYFLQIESGGLSGSVEIRFAANPTTGQIWSIFNTSDSIDVEISFANQAGKIDGAMTLSLDAQYEGVTLISGGVNLYSIGNNTG